MDLQEVVYQLIILADEVSFIGPTFFHKQEE
jgi:hypothetical protein